MKKKTTIFAITLGVAAIFSACGPSKSELAEQARQDSIRIADSLAQAQAEAERLAAEQEAMEQYQRLHSEELIAKLVTDAYALASSKNEKQAALTYGSEEFINKGKRYKYYASFCDMFSGTCGIKKYEVQSVSIKEMGEDKCTVTIKKVSTWHDYETNKNYNVSGDEDVELILVGDEWKINNIYKDGHDASYWMKTNTMCG